MVFDSCLCQIRYNCLQLPVSRCKQNVWFVYVCSVCWCLCRCVCLCVCVCVLLKRPRQKSIRFASGCNSSWYFRRIALVVCMNTNTACIAWRGPGYCCSSELVFDLEILDTAAPTAAEWQQQWYLMNVSVCACACVCVWRDVLHFI